MRTIKKNRDLKEFAASLREGLKFAQGKKANVKVETLYIQVLGADIREARQILKISQPEFASLMAVSPETVKKWEQGKNPIPAAVGYWAEGLKTRPETTKRLLFEMVGHFSKSGTRFAGH